MGRDRRSEILDVAREVFLEQGYAAASMSAIAARLGGSKGTLYNYFPSKEALFRAHIESECALSAENIFAGGEHGGPLEAQLTELGIRYLTILTSEAVMRNARAVIAEAGRNPEVGAIFYDAGPRAGAERLAAIFERAAEEGRLRLDDARMAAHHFLGLCQARVYKCRLFNVGGPPAASDIERDVGAAVTAFLGAYGTGTRGHGA